MPMIGQGATPYLEIEIDGFDLTDAQAVYVSIQQPLTQIHLTGDRVEASAEGSGTLLQAHLTQQETLSLSPGPASLQVRWKDADGEAFVSMVETVDIFRALYKGVI